MAGRALEATLGWKPVVPALTLSSKHRKGGTLGPDVSKAEHRDFSLSECLLMLGLSQESQAVNY